MLRGFSQKVRFLIELFIFSPKIGRFKTLLGSYFQKTFLPKSFKILKTDVRNVFDFVQGTEIGQKFTTCSYAQNGCFEQSVKMQIALTSKTVIKRAKLKAIELFMQCFSGKQLLQSNHRQKRETISWLEIGSDWLSIIISTFGFL